MNILNKVLSDTVREMTVEMYAFMLSLMWGVENSTVRNGQKEQDLAGINGSRKALSPQIPLDFKSQG